MSNLIILFIYLIGLVLVFSLSDLFMWLYLKFKTGKVRTTLCVFDLYK